jgi:hypothetical protein
MSALSFSRTDKAFQEKISEIYDFIFKKYHPIPWRDSISRPIAPISSVAGGDVTTRPIRQGERFVLVHKRT